VCDVSAIFSADLPFKNTSECRAYALAELCRRRSLAASVLPLWRDNIDWAEVYEDAAETTMDDAVSVLEHQYDNFTADLGYGNSDADDDDDDSDSDHDDGGDDS